ncbi:hypothetical protein GCM10023196_035540 [Actinoallomurus vinaceus]|uniref:Phage tail protein n=1 Tax=Actinoallomurus vinaceus TaxID=1080074 RepID=A0ABP8UDF4_9ACTN
MVATPISASSRYVNVNTTVVYWVPTIANKNSPTRSELNAGTNLVGENSAASGWTVKTDLVETPTMANRFTPKIPGRIQADDSSLTMYMDLGGTDARALMPADTNGFIVWCDGGDVTGRKMDVYPVRVASHSKPRSTEAKEAATVEIMYAITDQPAEYVTIP